MRRHVAYLLLILPSDKDTLYFCVQAILANMLLEFTMNDGCAASGPVVTWGYFLGGCCVIQRCYSTEHIYIFAMPYYVCGYIRNTHVSLHSFDRAPNGRLMF
jgi:hypothetical protein